MISELGGAAMHSGLQTRGLPGYRGVLSPRQIRTAVRAVRRLPHAARLDRRAREHAQQLGRVRLAGRGAAGRRRGRARARACAVHLDGARLANAAVASGVPAAAIGGMFDTVTLCLSKGLGAPLGALIAGSPELMARARVEKHRFGGAMRQAGIVAAAGPLRARAQRRPPRRRPRPRAAPRRGLGRPRRVRRAPSSSRRTSSRSTSATSTSPRRRRSRAWPTPASG